MTANGSGVMQAAMAARAEPEQAEVLYRQALKGYEELLRQTGAPAFARAAQDLCLTLADLDMDQGNMHGADVYYVRAAMYQRYPGSGREPNQCTK